MGKMEPRPTFASVALKIGDQRLEKTLERLADAVRTEIKNATFGAKRAVVRKNVERLKAETRRFEITLNRVSKHLLDLPSSVDWKSLSVARKAGRGIERFCEEALKLSKKGARPKEPGLVTCASIVIETWAIAHKGTPPGHNNEKAQQACEDYWRACGGLREGDAGRWSRHMIAARASRLRSQLRDAIRNPPGECVATGGWDADLE